MPEGPTATVSVNFDAETAWLGMFPETRAMPKTLSLGEYGASHGLARVLGTLADYGVKATFFVPGLTAERYPGAVEAIAAAGHEVGLRGYGGENLGLLPPADQVTQVTRGVEALKRLVGVVPVGFRAPWGEVSGAVLAAAAEMGFTYSSCLHTDDRPYYPAAPGVPLVEVPWQFELYDFPYFAFNYRPAFPDGQGRIAAYEAVLDNWLLEWEAYRQEGLHFHLVVTPQIIGTPGRISLLAKILGAIAETPGATFQTCREAAAAVTVGREDPGTTRNPSA
jgi:peptidoglycan/xylan/chitin deacetylase (PgdA/CDA1 family)